MFPHSSRFDLDDLNMPGGIANMAAECGDFPKGTLVFNTPAVVDYDEESDMCMKGATSHKQIHSTSASTLTDCHLVCGVSYKMSWCVVN